MCGGGGGVRVIINGTTFHRFLIQPAQQHPMYYAYYHNSSHVFEHRRQNRATGTRRSTIINGINN